MKSRIQEFVSQTSEPWGRLHRSPSQSQNHSGFILAALNIARYRSISRL